MSSDDAYNDESQGDAESLDMGAGAGEARGGGVRGWMNARRGWLVIGALAVAQAIFATILVALRSGAVQVGELQARNIRDLAVDMLGHEVGIKQIYQLVRVPGGRRMTIGLDVALILGQLPEERVEGAPRPTPEEFDVFINAVREMEPGIRSEVNSMLQRIPAGDYGTAEAHRIIKERIRDHINDGLERLDFGAGVRPGIGKRRVTEVFLPMLVRQAY